MKVVILAGGLGTRLAEETEVRPKPMVEIGGRPILWHILKHFAAYQLQDFYIALGYKGEVIKRYFLDYPTLNGNLTVHTGSGHFEVQRPQRDDWIVHLIDTGQETLTGGRVKRLEACLRSQGTFIVTYGDGVSAVNLKKLIAFHRSEKRLATVTAVRPPARFGGLLFDGNRVDRFTEKPQAGEGWINGGYLVFEPEVFDYLDSDLSSLEAHALEALAADGQLSAYRHEGFWQCMDTLRDKKWLESLWQSGQAPWCIWNKPIAGTTQHRTRKRKAS